jgi:hypothetical protein
LVSPAARAHLETPLGVVTHHDEIEAIQVLVQRRQSLIDTQTQTISGSRDHCWLRIAP